MSTGLLVWSDLCTCFVIICVRLWKLQMANINRDIKSKQQMNQYIVKELCRLGFSANN